jgi:hypothetical protein
LSFDKQFRKYYNWKEIKSRKIMTLADQGTRRNILNHRYIELFSELTAAGFDDYASSLRQDSSPDSILYLSECIPSIPLSNDLRSLGNDLFRANNEGVFARLSHD